jgi:hypothetical protein
MLIGRSAVVLKRLRLIYRYAVALVIHLAQLGLLIRLRRYLLNQHILNDFTTKK